MAEYDDFLAEHRRLTRRYFLRLGATGACAGLFPRAAAGDDLSPECARACAEALKKLEYLTPQEKFGEVVRGKPRPYDLPDEIKRKAGLTRETWKLEVVPDPDADPPAVLDNPLTIAAGNALDWTGLMELAKKHAVSFPKIMTCNNIGRPLGMGLWEGVPLREAVWLARPRENVRRVFYPGYHDGVGVLEFRSSLPVGRVLEDPFGLPPVILCFKLNGDYLTDQRGGPVRIVVPENYGFKSVKWVNRVFLSNLPHANDTYAEKNNDVDSLMKTFAGTLSVPGSVSAGEVIPVTGYAQVGVSGLAEVQTWVTPEDTEWPRDDPYFTEADWKKAEILSPPNRWGGGLPENQLPEKLHGFDAETGRPKRWPMMLTMAHWAAALPGLPAGRYTLRARTIDAAGAAQPMPRPFRKSGRNAIEKWTIEVV